ncbi:hypothetical protein PYCCODRAFT_976884 [Trametes coccinea BRFM310]|uniref:Uncharacterized protein n=1 Tax=Trametes coccinea (strain BRFM310) TaxID=1353009 RepID=A0A1Y2IDQ2_TRAC3|nr:hypothetical protein PYCCODRAFT_976884 [Trametes coccinea BRFM310]
MPAHRTHVQASPKPRHHAFPSDTRHVCVSFSVPAACSARSLAPPMCLPDGPELAVIKSVRGPDHGHRAPCRTTRCRRSTRPLHCLAGESYERRGWKALMDAIAVSSGVDLPLTQLKAERRSNRQLSSLTSTPDDIIAAHMDEVHRKSWKFARAYPSATEARHDSGCAHLEIGMDYLHRMYTESIIFGHVSALRRFWRGD